MPLRIPFMSNKPLSARTRKFLANIPVVASIFFAVLVIVEWSTERFDRPPPSGPPVHGFILPDKVAKLLGPYSPWYPVEFYVRPPPACNITQVNILHRHGARYPTKGQTERIQRALSRINPPSKKNAHSVLGFTRTYKYQLKTDELLWFGATEAFASVVASYNRYSDLAHVAPPFLRAGDSSRVVQTGLNWARGFETASRIRLKKPLIISETPGQNNTLHGGQSCPAHDDEPANRAQAAWLSHFAPNITARLNAAAPGSTLQDEDIPMLMSLCSFESLYHYSTSPWCHVFHSSDEGTDEWAAYEYWGDLEKFYNTGPGNALGRVQGIGWVNELIARLTDSPVNDTTTVNHTLDSNPETFPLSPNVTMYADFSHDNEMNAIFATLGLLRMVEARRSGKNLLPQSLPLDYHVETEQVAINAESLSISKESDAIRVKEMDPEKPDPNRKWVASRLVPFAARLVVERLECPNPNTTMEKKSPSIKAMRMLLNDAVVHVPGCQESEKILGNGVCDLDKFVETQAYARNGGVGEWERCRTNEE